MIQTISTRTTDLSWLEYYGMLFCHLNCSWKKNPRGDIDRERIILFNHVAYFHKWQRTEAVTTFSKILTMMPFLPKHTRPGKRYISFRKLCQIFKDHSNPKFSWTTRTDCFLQLPHPPRKLAAISDWHSTYLQVTQANPHRRSSAWSSLNTSTASHKQLQESLWKRIIDGGQISSQSVASLGGSGPVGSYCHVLVATCSEGFEPLLGITWVGDRLWCGDVGVCTQTDITAGFEPLLGNIWDGGEL